MLKAVGNEYSLPEIPEALITAGIQNRLVILVGAGASRGAGLPAWGELVRNLLEAAQSGIWKCLNEGDERVEAGRRDIRDALDKEQFSLAAATIERLLSEGGDPDPSLTIANEVVRQFRSVEAKPTAIHRTLAMMTGVRFLTTNYDQLLEESLEDHKGKAPNVVLLSDNVGLMNYGPGDLLKLHGDLDQPETIVLTISDYSKVGHDTNLRAWQQKFKSLLQEYEVLTVGYGYGDVDIKAQIDELRGDYRWQMKGPWWLEKTTSRTKVLAASHGLRLIELRDHTQLEPWLRALANEIDQARKSAPLPRHLQPLIQEVTGSFDRDRDYLRTLFHEGDLEQAKCVAERILERSRRVLEGTPSEQALQRQVALDHVNLGGCLLGLDERQEARKHLHLADVETLSPEQRNVLAMGLSRLGEFEKAREIWCQNDNQLNTAAQQTLSILEGTLPPEPLVNWGIKLDAAHLLYRQGKMHDAALLALEVFDEEDVNAPDRLNATSLLRACLQSTVIDSSMVVQPLMDRPELRERVVETIEIQLDHLEECPLSGRFFCDYLNLRAVFFELCLDRERSNAARQRLSEAGCEVTGPDAGPANARATQEAQQGDLEQAFELLPEGDGPWYKEHCKAALEELVDRFDVALERMRRLVEQWPGRPPLEGSLAELLYHSRAAEEALPHARRAFQSLPGRGFRRLFAACLLSCGEFEQAYELSEPLSDSNDAGIIELRALAAEQTQRLAEACELWRKVCAQRPEKFEAAHRLASCLFRLSESQKAADVMWTRAQGAKLDSSKLEICAKFQFLSTHDPATIRERVDGIVAMPQLLSGAGDDRAESVRYRLLVRLGVGAAERATPPTHQGTSLEDTAYKERNRLALRVRGMTKEILYRTGQLPFELLSEAPDPVFPGPTVFTRIAAVRSTIEQSAPHNPLLSTPISLRALPILSLAGSNLLLGELELLVLDYLDLLPALANALEPRGTVQLFVDVELKITQNAVDLHANAPGSELKRFETLSELLNNPSRICRVSTTAWDTEPTTPLIDTQSSHGVRKQIPVQRMLRWLHDQGAITQDKLASFLHRLPSDQVPDLGEPFPSRCGITFPALRAVDAEVVRELTELENLELVVSDHTRGSLSEHIAGLKLEIDASDRARRIQRWVGIGRNAGWLKVSPRPDVSDALSKLGVKSAASTDLGAATLSRVLSWYRTLREHPDWRLLCTDFVIADLFSYADHSIALSMLDCSVADLGELKADVLLTRDRLISVSDVVALIAPPAKQHALRWELAYLGFHDVLRPQDLVETAHCRGGLDKRRVVQRLDRAEWMSVDTHRPSGVLLTSKGILPSAHAGMTAARFALATRYADAIWLAWCGVDSMKSGLNLLDPGATFPLVARPTGRDRNLFCESLTDSLLARAELLDRNRGNRLRVLELLFFSIASKTYLELEASFKPLPNSTELTIDESSATTVLWRHLATWTGPIGSRRAAYSRSVRDLLCLMDKLAGERSAGGPGMDALFLAAEAPRHPTNVLSFTDPELSAFVTLSANWKEGPLEHFGTKLQTEGSPETETRTLQRLLKRAVETFEHMVRTDDLCGLDGSRFNWTYLMDLAPNQPIRVFVPPEAILLRLSPNAVEKLAPILAVHYGPHDGKLHGLLLELRIGAEINSHFQHVG